VSDEWFYIQQWQEQREEDDGTTDRRPSKVQGSPQQDRTSDGKDNERLEHYDEVFDVLQSKVVRLGCKTRCTLVDDRDARNDSKKSKKHLTTTPPPVTL